MGNGELGMGNWELPTSYSKTHTHLHTHARTKNQPPDPIRQDRTLRPCYDCKHKLR